MTLPIPENRVNNEIREKIDSLLARLADCDICPRQCHVDRYSDAGGICGMGAGLWVSSANLHFGEEPPLSGTRGSGTIFLTGCNLKCCYCQNYPISQMHHGRELSLDEFIETMLGLERRGAHNINFVTPTHYSAQISEAILGARNRGLRVPIVWNSSGYDRVDVLRSLEGLIEIYLPDMRYADSGNADCYSSAPDYPEINRAAIKEMFRQVGNLEMDDHGAAKRGLIIRHLVMPDFVTGTREILRFIADEISRDCAVSLMSQYFPAHKAFENDTISRRITSKEYNQAVAWMTEFGLENGWSQNEEL